MAAPPLRKAFRFGTFEVDLRSSELRKSGLRIKLQGKPFQILAVLLQRPGETVSREELRRELWPQDEYGEFDQSLNTAMKKLRQALGDSAETPRFVETQARLGYRFVAPVEVIGEQLVSPAAPEIETAPKARPLAGWLFGAALILALGFLLLLPRIWRSKEHAMPAMPGRIASIAVLPLANLSPGAEQDYFADGLTDSLITKLAQISALRVISRTSAMQYKGTHKLLPEIGRELNVNGIVEGAVQREGPRVRVSMKLIQAASEQNLWAEVYERDLKDILSLENDMAAAIARKIEVRITPQESVELSRSRRLDPDAYEAYLKGRFFWNTRSEDNLRKAIQYFDRALAKEPTYPLAYAGLADCYNVFSFYGLAKPAESFPKAKAAATKALELDEGVAEAHAALGYVRLHYDWDWSDAESEFRRALELNPGYANAHHWYSHYFLAFGRTEDAFAVAQRALKLDPLSQSINAHMGHHYIYVERYDDAIAQMKTTLEMNPASARSHAWLGRAYEGRRMFGKAKAEFQEASRLSGNDPQFTAGMAHVYATEGSVENARKLLNQLKRQSSRRYISPYALAEVHAALGEHDQAFDYLARAADARQEELIYIKIDPNLKQLRADSRFAELVHRVHLPL